jgi:hypothetical protein
MAYDDDDDWPPPERDPEKLAALSRERMAAIREQRQRILRWTYAGLAALVILIVLLATLR